MITGFAQTEREDAWRGVSMIESPKDKISYTIICEKFPVPRLYFDSYELAENG